MGAEVRREWFSILNHWLVGAVMLTVATGIGTAVFAPPPEASAWQRVAFASLGVSAGVIAVMLGASSWLCCECPLRSTENGTDSASWGRT